MYGEGVKMEREKMSSETATGPSIVDILQAVGPENVTFQMLSASLLKSMDGKKYTRVTFATDISTADIAGRPPKQIGMIVWMPADKMEEAKKLWDTPAPQPEACRWEYDAEEDRWRTTCGEKHFIDAFDGTLAQTGFKYCPYCGKPITEAK
jgi:hypothetical protein